VRAAYLITGNLASAEDVTQNAFIQAFERIRQFDDSRAFAPWFLRSVVNSAVKNARRNSRQVQGESAADEAWFESLFGRGESAEAQVESLAFQQEIQSALLKLSPRQRAVIVRKYYLEMSEKEMAEALEIAPGTVKWLLNAARERLRGLLKGAGNE
jgi:RNA polymerase sigma-70 factor (ECF subfamily)